MEKAAEKIHTIGIIGGGKVGLELLSLYSNSHLTKVSYVVDQNQNAPAIQAAQKSGITTFSEIEQALKTETDFIFEVTGSDKVVEILEQKLDHCFGKLITHNMAYIILEVIEGNSNKVASEIGDIKSKIDNSLGEIGTLVDDIEDVTSEMRILALNARIEAARVGDQGKGFAVVAQQMAESVNSVREISQQIEKINAAIQTTSDQIEISMNKLKQ
jgi:Methyl-accepting chemotaxis protein (MCP) signalling domain